MTRWRGRRIGRRAAIMTVRRTAGTVRARLQESPRQGPEFGRKPAFGALKAAVIFDDGRVLVEEGAPVRYYGADATSDLRRSARYYGREPSPKGAPFSRRRNAQDGLGAHEFGTTLAPHLSVKRCRAFSGDRAGRPRGANSVLSKLRIDRLSEPSVTIGANGKGRTMRIVVGSALISARSTTAPSRARLP
jgi:hypothetical protein